MCGLCYPKCCCRAVGSSDKHRGRAAQQKSEQRVYSGVCRIGVQHVRHKRKIELRGAQSSVGE